LGKKGGHAFPFWEKKEEERKMKGGGIGKKTGLQKNHQKGEKKKEHDRKKN